MNQANFPAYGNAGAGLGSVSLLAELNESTRAAFAKSLCLRTVKPGQIVVEQGERTDDLYIVFSGRLLGLLLSANGKEVAFTEIGRASYFGELAALDGQPRSITVSALSESQLGVMHASMFCGWIEREPRIGFNLARDLAKRNRTLTERIFGLVVHDVDKRVRVLLSRLAQSTGQLRPGGVLEPAPTHDAIATYVGANREAVSRVIARLSSDGMIEAGRRRIVFHNIDALLSGL
ncbi:Crp/Fnr family transcriptional regulator [Sinorhizobium americanum]|uniref:CRP-like cAMP-binding protein n=1 Tax=Sinorhizobium americanum TaxID=194963 RepID=A0A4R2AVV9_9HYPH|nr:Crp/Fnr family transcriptional regulator [Sinorhizobium americanum]TCN17294.1 CRP-like cAMP-binding protein [Sinorhizobium americanum]